MSNIKSSVENFWKQLEEKGYASQETEGVNTINISIDVNEYLALKQQAKAQHKKETIDFALHCMMPKLNPDKSTIEVVSDIYDEVFGGN